MAKALSKDDPNSFSNPEDCSVRHINFNLSIDFSKKVLKGFVELTVHRKTANSNLILDSSGLLIHGISAKGIPQNLPYNLGKPLEDFGSKLEVQLPENLTNEFLLRIDYETSPVGSAFQWLEPEQTSGKKHPYMFTSCQSIHARSMFPCQDTPNVKTTYTAMITAPKELTVLMSALHDGEGIDTELNAKIFKFTQKVPLASYLIVVVCGALESRKLGPRSRIWAEIEYLDKAAEEFSDTEKMLQLAEKYAGEYVWGVYDLLVMPPSFSFGGMENPCLTFITTTLLAGDKSNVSVIIHEIMHSWTGNLVTNKNFEHFWLNEGFTRFIENKVLGLLLGDDHRLFEAASGYLHLENDIKKFGEDNPCTRLVTNLTGINPDDYLNFVPYEKGHTFLFYLETILGGPEVFDGFLRSYIEEYKYQSIDTDIWKNYLYKYFSDKEDILNQVDWDKWLYGTGYPPVKPKYDCHMMTMFQTLADQWIDANEECLDKFNFDDIKAFSSNQIREFLATLNKKEMSIKKLRRIDEVYKISCRGHYEIRFLWIMLCLKSHLKEVIPNALSFVTEQGRAKFVEPVYRSLYDWEETREIAISNYKKQKNEMTHHTASVVARALRCE